MKEFSIEKPIPYYEQFYHSIKKMIFDGTYKPGERIVETQLAKQFGVSKSPVREAIRLLEKEGLVVVDDKSRVMVYEPTLKDVEDIYYCRMALESFAVSLTVALASDKELNEIKTALEEAERAIQRGAEASEIIALNAKFHRFIVQFTKNKRLQKQVDDLKSLTQFYRILHFQDQNRASIILREHQQIFGHIRSRNKEKASQEMITHLEHDLAHITQVLQQMT
ncbi:GntR family transcriptional regulator [Domibacillus indicus]|uniref:GntR family transcriptional regulator n=1 Tax=Domibacillus indicus TaxID=1437523 RepID=UPI0006181092|nr:GntR family transcriptional regulator [Domibacillus indicus]